MPCDKMPCDCLPSPIFVSQTLQNKMKGIYNGAGSKMFVKIDSELFKPERNMATFTHILNNAIQIHDFGFWKLYKCKLPSKSVHILVSKHDKVPIEGTVTKTFPSSKDERIKISTDTFCFGITQYDVYNEMCCFGYHVEETGDGMVWDASKPNSNYEKWYRN